MLSGETDCLPGEGRLTGDCRARPRQDPGGRGAQWDRAGPQCWQGERRLELLLLVTEVRVLSVPRAGDDLAQTEDAVLLQRVSPSHLAAPQSLPGLARPAQFALVTLHCRLELSGHLSQQRVEESRAELLLEIHRGLSLKLLADDDLLLVTLLVTVVAVLGEHFLPVLSPRLLTVDWSPVSLPGPPISLQHIGLSSRDGQRPVLSRPALLYLHLTADQPQLGEIFPPEETFFFLYRDWLGLLLSQTFRSVKQVLKLVEKVLNYLCGFLLVFLKMKMKNISNLSWS